MHGNFDSRGAKIDHQMCPMKDDISDTESCSCPHHLHCCQNVEDIVQEIVLYPCAGWRPVFATIPNAQSFKENYWVDGKSFTKPERFSLCKKFLFF